MFVLTKHTNASSEFSVRVKWLLLGFPRIDTFGGAEKNYIHFSFYFGVKTPETNTKNTNTTTLFTNNDL